MVVPPYHDVVTVTFSLDDVLRRSIHYKLKRVVFKETKGRAFGGYRGYLRLLLKTSDEPVIVIDDAKERTKLLV